MTAAQQFSEQCRVAEEMRTGEGTRSLACQTGPIFIVGTGRSGTTLLRLMLSAHPRIYICHEASFWVWDGLFGRHQSGTAFLRYYLQTFSFRWLGLQPAAVLRQVAQPLPRHRSHEFFTAVMRLKAEQCGRIRFGDKTPNHAAHLHRIFGDYPDARVIHVVRDPREVVLSLARMPWASRSWIANGLMIESERRRVEPFADRILQVRLEDLLALPRQTMERVLHFVGEPWDEAVLDHSHHLPSQDAMAPLAWLVGATHPRRPQPHSPAWKALPADRLQWLEDLTRASLRAYGYAAVSTARRGGGTTAGLVRRGGALRLRRIPLMVSDLAEAFRFLRWALRLGRLSRDAQNFDGMPMRRALERLNPQAWSLYPQPVIPDPPPLEPGWDASLSGAGDLTPTALYTAQTWTWAGFDCADLFASPLCAHVFRATNLAVGLVRLLRRDVPSLRHSLVQRRAMLDALLRDSQAQQVLELAAGLSPRGAAMTRDARIRFTELDLKPMIDTKRSLLGNSAQGRAVLSRPNLRLVEGDVNTVELDPLVDPEHPLFLVAEGIFVYLKAEQQRALWRRVAALVGGVPGSAFAFDLVPACEQPRPGLLGRCLEGLMRLFTRGQSMEFDTRTRDDIIAELHAAGFGGVEVISPRAAPASWRIPFLRKHTQVLIFHCWNGSEPAATAIRPSAA